MMASLPALLSVLLWLASTAIGALVAFFAFQRAIDKKFAELDVDRVKAALEVAGELHRINDHLDTIDEWIVTLRKRSHEMIEKFQAMFLKIDRIEQRERHVRRTDKE